MANKQTFPQSIYPINGDVTSQDGNPDVTVVGIQQTPVLNQKPTNGQILIYDQPTNNYVPGDPIVSGPDAPGSTPTVNPVQVAGIDEGNLVRELRTDTYGSLRSIRIEQLLYQILLELRSLKAVTVNQDTSILPGEFDADNFVQLGEIS